MTSPNPTGATPNAVAATGAGLWIRVAANLTRRKVTWRLTEACLAKFPVPEGAPRSLMQKAAAGFLMELWGNIAEHTVDGVVADFSDAQLENWAGWDGEPGAFARWLRAQHLDAETKQVREWQEFAGALQAKRALDAQRQRDKRERERSARQLLDGAPPAATTVTPAPKPEKKAPRPEPVEPVSLKPAIEPAAAAPRVESPYRDPVVPVALDGERITDLARELTIAANKGMADNEKLGGIYNPIHAGRGDSHDLVTFLAAEGVGARESDWEFIGRIVYTIAKQFTPERRGDQIKSLAFFRDKTLAMWRRALARAAAEKAGPIAEVSIGRNGANVTGSRAARSTAGALAGADAAGLADD